MTLSPCPCAQGWVRLALVLALASLHFPCAISGLAFLHMPSDEQRHTRTPPHWLTSSAFSPPLTSCPLVCGGHHRLSLPFLSRRVPTVSVSLASSPLSPSSGPLDALESFASRSPSSHVSVSHVSCQPSRSFMTPLASSPRSLCPLVRSRASSPRSLCALSCALLPTLSILP